jgi:hypothetical protein
MAATTTLKFDEIVLHPDLQGRKRISDEHVDDIAEAVEKRKKIKRPRVIRVTDRDNQVFAIDQHRVKAYGKVQKVVPVVLFEGTWQDARDMAMSSNVEHTALKLTTDDKERMVREALTDHNNWSDGKVAKHTGTSHTFVAEVRKSIPKAAATTERVGSDNKVRRTPSRNGATVGGRGKRGGKPDGEASTRNAASSFDWKLLEQHFGWLKRAVDNLSDLALAASLPAGKEGEEPDKEKVTRAKGIVKDETKKTHAALNGFLVQVERWKRRITQT